jgi:hypothetical protein
MTYTGNLIEDLMATVERSEQRAQAHRDVVTEPMLVEPMLVEPMLVEPMLVEPMFVESWFASVQQSTEYDSKLLGVA